MMIVGFLSLRVCAMHVKVVGNGMGIDSHAMHVNAIPYIYMLEKMSKREKNFLIWEELKLEDEGTSLIALYLPLYFFLINLSSLFFNFFNFLLQSSTQPTVIICSRKLSLNKVNRQISVDILCFAVYDFFDCELHTVFNIIRQLTKMKIFLSRTKFLTNILKSRTLKI